MVLIRLWHHYLDSDIRQALHNKLQSIIQAMMNLRGIALENEAANVLLESETHVARRVSIMSHPTPSITRARITCNRS